MSFSFAGYHEQIIIFSITHVYIMYFYYHRQPMWCFYSCWLVSLIMYLRIWFEYSGHVVIDTRNNWLNLELFWINKGTQEYRILGLGVLGCPVSRMYDLFHTPQTAHCCRFVVSESFSFCDVFLHLLCRKISYYNHFFYYYYYYHYYYYQSKNLKIYNINNKNNTYYY